MFRPRVKNMSSPKKALNVAMVMTMEITLNPWIRSALISPRPMPTSPATTNPTAQLPPPIPIKAWAAMYWTTEAATAKEISIPPAIRTTRSPTAQIRFTALLLRSDVRLPSVRNVSVRTESPMIIRSRTTLSRASTGWV